MTMRCAACGAEQLHNLIRCEQCSKPLVFPEIRDLEVVVVPRELFYHENEYVRGLENVVSAVLLFHRGGPWTDEDRLMWIDLTGTEEATTKTLCDFARKAVTK